MRTSTALRRSAAALVVATIAVASSFLGAALAGGGQTFSDVSPGHPFYDEIEWLADSGITTGYPDGTYRPGAPVSRQAMAAYLQRLTAGISTHQSESVFASSRTFWASDAYCPAGKRAIAGGGYTSAQDAFLYSSYPIGGNGWSVAYEVPPGAGAQANISTTTFVTCVPQTSAG